jgi:hypothetical protein
MKKFLEGGGRKKEFKFLVDCPRISGRGKGNERKLRLKSPARPPSSFPFQPTSFSLSNLYPL